MRSKTKTYMQKEFAVEIKLALLDEINDLLRYMLKVRSVMWNILSLNPGIKNR